MSRLRFITQCCGFGGEKLQKSLYHIPALDWNVRIPFGLYRTCDGGGGASGRRRLCGCRRFFYPCGSPAERWTLKVGAFLGSEVILANCYFFKKNSRILICG